MGEQEREYLSFVPSPNGCNGQVFATLKPGTRNSIPDLSVVGRISSTRGMFHCLPSCTNGNQKHRVLDSKWCSREGCHCSMLQLNSQDWPPERAFLQFKGKCSGNPNQCQNQLIFKRTFCSNVGMKIVYRLLLRAKYFISASNIVEEKRSHINIMFLSTWTIYNTGIE